MYKILLIEDDLTIAESGSNHLQKWGYITKYAEEFVDIMPLFKEYAPDMVLLDIMPMVFWG